MVGEVGEFQVDSTGLSAEGGGAPVEESPDPAPVPDEEQHERKEYATLVNGVLSPRHRRLAELLAQGQLKNGAIAEALGYSESRVSILKNHPLILEETARIRERIYEDTIAIRMKAMADPALNVIETALLNRENRYKKSEQLDAAKWTIEKLDGKAAQKVEVSGGILSSLIDKIDALKSSGRSVSDLPDIDVTAGSLGPGASESPPQQPAPISDELADWIDGF